MKNRIVKGKLIYSEKIITGYYFFIPKSTNEIPNKDLHIIIPKDNYCFYDGEFFISDAINNYVVDENTIEVI